jgi:hypothetical protein
MNRKRKTLVILILTTVVALVLMTRTSRVIDDGSIQAREYRRYGVTIISFENGFDFIYKPSESVSVMDAGVDLGYDYVINGSFFRQNREHAGWLSILGEKIAPYKDDRQLSHVVRYCTHTGVMTFIDVQSFSDGNNKKLIEFQTGPLVVENNRLSHKYIDASINGSVPHRRTLLAYTRGDHTKHFIIVRKPVTLETIGEYLLTLPMFSNGILNVVNLDGGACTALYSKNHPSLNYNEKEKLPIFLAIPRR